MFSACPIFKPKKPFWYVCNTSDCNILRWDILTEGFCHLKLRHWDFLSPKLALVGNCSWSGGWWRQNTLFLHGAVFLRRRTNCSIQKLWHDAHVSIPCYVYALINLHIIWCWIKIFHQPEILPFGDDSRYNPWSMVTSQRRRYNSAKYIQIYVYYEIMYIIYFITCIYSIKWVSLKIGYFKIRWIIIMFPIRMTLLDVTIFSHTHISLSEESNKTTSGHCSLKPYRTSLRLEGQAEDYYRRCCSEHGRRGWRNQKQTKQTAWNLHRSA